MTSAPQQPGWPPAEEPPAQPAHGGFDLFEAPPVPDSFPVFTPFREDQQGEPDYPHDQSPVPFSGFPESAAAEQYTPESYSPESYTPEPYTPEPYTPAPLLSDQAGTPTSEPYVPAPAALPIPGVTHDVAGSWPAFSANKPADPEPSFGAHSSGSPDSSESYPAATPFPAAEPYEPYSAAEHEPVQWSPIQWPSSTELASPEPEPAVAWPSASNDPAPEPEPQAPAAPAPSPSPAPAAPVAEAAAVVATARVSAASAVPAINRATPDEIPAALPKPAPRVYGRPAQAEPEPVVVEMPSAPDAEQQSRGAARAAVPQARSSQEEVARPPIARSSTVYGAPARPAEQAAPPAPMAAPQRQSSFSDLIPQAAPSQAAPPMQPMPMPAQGAPPMGARPAPMGPIPTGGPGQAPMGALQPHNSPSGAPPMVPAQRGPAQPMADEPSIAIETKPVRSGRLVVLVIGGCVALLAVAFGVLFGVSKLIGGGDEQQFKVSSCVKQTGGQAAVANCSEAGTFTIISIETDVAKCADKTQPYVKYGTQVLCLRANK